MPTTLLILAAGLGSRYGSMKQLDPVGPSQETLMDYSIYDARLAGFDKIVFVIRRSFEQKFRESFLHKAGPNIEVHLAFQEIDNVPQDIAVTEERYKPWGTAHAVWTARDLIHEPFAMINADDFYGREAFIAMARFLKNEAPFRKNHYAMIGYRLDNTLSLHGTVSRGVCSTKHNILVSIEEHTRILKCPEGEITDTASNKAKILSPDTLVSMNFWGFTPTLFYHLEEKLQRFFSHYAQNTEAELFLPLIIDQLIKEGEATVEIIPSPAQWFGITYPEDRNPVKEKLRNFHHERIYPESLFI